MRTHRILAVLLAPVLALTLTNGTTAAAKPGKTYPAVVPLPVDFRPEGVATWGHTFYSGSLADGDIYRGDLRDGTGAVFIDRTGRAAAGLKVDRRHGLLFVAGAGTGHAFVYDALTGADVADLSLGGTFVNDVVVTRDAAYFTESRSPQLYRVPINEDGTLGTPTTLAVTGPAAEATTGFGLNGIVATANGKRLIVGHTTFGKLYSVDPASGASTQIAVTGGSLTAGTLDGLLRIGKKLWVVENRANRLTKLRLSKHWTLGTVKRTVTHPEFETPTTVARHGSRLAVVNAKFNLGNPPPAGTPFEVVQFNPKKLS